MTSVVGLAVNGGELCGFMVFPFSGVFCVIGTDVFYRLFDFGVFFYFVSYVLVFFTVFTVPVSAM